MADMKQDFPYKNLGARLKGARQKLHESLADVSGAVEIEPTALSEIEQGTDRPSEDILLLLISHFAIKEDEATKLWELAGYEQTDTGTISMSADAIGDIKNAVIIPLDTRISYTDMAHVVVNDHGVVLNFMQTAGPGSQPLTISRLGMSREHAQSVIELLQKTLAEHNSHQTKSLPQPAAEQDIEQKSQQ